ncbi:MAG: hypothetical protein Ct9H300mP6_11540 [Gammaproteobacteria bacterium]|nr:MAG: hypothetical protein Ct9H300mP6_11540 [Gammaproteobacteria bacterium]
MLRYLSNWKQTKFYDARYQVSGCPHLIGLTSLLIKKIIGNDTTILQEFKFFIIGRGS